MGAKKIAIIIPGGIGIGNYNDGVPILENMVRGLAKNYLVNVFSLVRISHGYVPSTFKIHHSGFKTGAPGFIKFIGLFVVITSFILRNRVSAFHGFWSVPSGFLAVLFAKMTLSKSIVSIQGGDLVNFTDIRYGGSQGYFRRNLIKWTLKHSQVNTVESNFMMTQLQEFRPGTKANLVYYGVDTSLFHFNERKIESPIRFIHIANQNLVKDQETLVKAFVLIRRSVNCTLAIIGDDFLNGKIVALVQQYDLEKEVSFLGYQAQIDIPMYLAHADIMLHTSRHESTAMVVLEAMAAGVLVCGTAVGIISDLAPSHCVSVPVGDFVKLASETLLLVRDPQRMNKMRFTARKWTESKDLNNTISELSNLYQ